MRNVFYDFRTSHGILICQNNQIYKVLKIIENVIYKRKKYMYLFLFIKRITYTYLTKKIGGDHGYPWPQTISATATICTMHVSVDINEDLNLISLSL